MGRYTQFQTAQSLPIAAANEGGGAAATGVGLGAGILMAGQMMSALKGDKGGQETPPGAAPAAEPKFCIHCGKPIPAKAKFCPECGSSQQ